jgi:C-terminal peptidase prc
MNRSLSLLLIASITLLACSSVTELQQYVPPSIQNVVGTPVPTAAPTPSNTDRQLKLFEEIYSSVKDQYVLADYGGVKLDDVKKDYETKIKAGMSNADFEKAMKEFAGKMPNGSVVFQTRAERLQAETEDSVKYSGIGAYIAVRKTPQPHVVILSVIKDSPAEKAGLLPHDSIYSIDDKPVTAEEGLDVIKRVRGQAGSTISLEVQTAGKSKRTVKITRDQITAGDALRGGLIERAGIVYFLLPVVTPENMIEIMAQNLEAYSKRAQLRGIVLDLRVAHGAGWPIEEMLTLFGTGKLGQFYTRAGNTELTIKGIDVGGSQTLPLVLLIGPDTEGTPEVFASALQASQRAVVLGMPTTGKVFGYTTLPLNDGSRLTLATSSYKNTKGDELAKIGVTPDFEIKLDWDQVTMENDQVIDRAFQAILLFR